MTDDPRAEELNAEIAAKLRPLAKCEPVSEEERCILAAKREFVAELDRLGLGERAAARLLGKSPSTVAGWCDLRDRRRYPPKHVYRLLAVRAGREVLLREARSSVRASDTPFDAPPDSEEIALTA